MQNYPHRILTRNKVANSTRAIARLVELTLQRPQRVIVWPKCVTHRENMLASRALSKMRISTGARSAARAMSSVAPENETYSERMAKKGRPVSPHVQIYKFPTVAISSITNRVTGVMLSIGVTGIGASTVVGVDPSTITAAIASVETLAFIPKFAVAFPLVYHYLGGVRHIVWDRNPEALTNEQVEQSSAILLGGSAALSAGLAFLTI